MVLPLADDNSGQRTTPWINYGLIAANVFVFVVIQQLGTNDDFTYSFSTVPRAIVTGEDVVTEDHDVRDPVSGQVIRVPGRKATPGSVYLTLITSMFMHGGIAHLLGNMLFLYIFGDNIEDAMGHGRYLIYYLLCGILASLAHVFTVVGLDGIDSPAALIPSLGASGAISGVLGGYLILFPNRRVLVLLLRVLVWVPAYVAIGIWFVFQIVNGLGLFGESSQESGVAHAAHVGGFVAGVALIKLFTLGRDPGRSAWPQAQR
jgi:membrane associated rhomboid family serine protease